MAQKANNSLENGYTAEELARDASQPRRQLGNAITALWDIDSDELTARETSRLTTIQTKIQELESIIEEREVAEMRQEMDTEGTSQAGQEYELEALFEAYKKARPDDGRQFVAWSLFRNAYGDGAKDDFLAALNNDDIEVSESKPGIRADGQWPRYNTGRLWLDFNF